MYKSSYLLTYLQRIVRPHSQTALCTAKLTAEECQSVRGNTQSGGAEALNFNNVASSRPTYLGRKPRRTAHIPYYVNR